MSTRQPAHPASPAAATGLGDLPRQQLAAWTRAACALFHGFETMRKVQLEAAQQARSRRESTAARLCEPCNPMDLLALQADLLQFDLQAATAYWQRLGAAAVEMQRALWTAAVTSPTGGGAAALPGAPATSPFFFHVEGMQQPAAA